MAIEYQTEGKLVIDDPKGRAKGVALTWLKGDTNVRLHQGGSASIELSAYQLRELHNHIEALYNDLED